MRWLSAHLAAMLVGSFLIMTGIDTLLDGWRGGIGGAGKWLGGLLIFVIIALLAAPIGFGLRLVLGRLRQLNLPAAVIAGVLVGLALIPVLHPGMYPGLSIETQPVGLLLVHVVAGSLAGLAWFGVELLQTPRPRGVA